MFRIVILAAAIGLALGALLPAMALPPFARNAGASCQLCHFRMPELNETGRSFLLRGLRGDTTADAAKAAADLGAPVELDAAKFLSVMGDHGVAFARGARPDIDAGGVDLWAAGPLSPHWSASVDAAFDVAEGGVDVEQAYAQYVTSGGPRFVSVRAGQSLPLALLYVQGGPGMPLSAPAALELAPDTGSGWSPLTPLRCVELGSVSLGRGDLFIGAAQPQLDGLDSPHTDLYATASLLLGHSDNLLTLYGYQGKAPVDGSEESFHRYGLFATLYPAGAKCVLGYLAGSDDQPGGMTPGEYTAATTTTPPPYGSTSLDNRGYFLLYERPLSERFAVYGRYDHATRDLAAGGSETVKGPTLGATWWPQSQLRLTAEAQFLSATGEPSGRTLGLNVLWVY